MTWRYSSRPSSSIVDPSKIFCQLLHLIHVLLRKQQRVFSCFVARCNLSLKCFEGFACGCLASFNVLNRQLFRNIRRIQFLKGVVNNVPGV